jgi:hypothetical protein
MGRTAKSFIISKRNNSLTFQITLNPFLYYGEVNEKEYKDFYSGLPCHIRYLCNYHHNNKTNMTTDEVMARFKLERAAVCRWAAKNGIARKTKHELLFSFLALGWYCRLAVLRAFLLQPYTHT